MISASTIDTNILIYSVDVSEILKYPIAKRIVRTLGSGGAPLAVQCLSEFYYAATRKRILSVKQAEETVRGFLGFFPCVSSFPEDVVSAMSLHQQHDLQFFDALLLAVARRAGCTIFLTEDMQHNRLIDGITIVNPFLLSPVELNQLLA